MFLLMLRGPPLSTRTLTLSLHDALPVFLALLEVEQRDGGAGRAAFGIARADRLGPRQVRGREGEALGLRRRVAGGLHLSTSPNRSEEHTSELQSLMRISYAVFCLKKKK